MKFNKLLALVGACATFGLVACGDDSSSGSDSSKTEKLSIVNLDETTNIQVEVGEVATPYVAYQSSSLSMMGENLIDHQRTEPNLRLCSMYDPAGIKKTKLNLL